MNKKEQKRIEDAEKVIERFGGIRPMASKMDVPVTTVQGWKKRNAIPSSRYEDIVRAAEENNVEIADILGSIPAANQNTQESLEKAQEDSKTERSVSQKEKRVPRPAQTSQNKENHVNLDKDSKKDKITEDKGNEDKADQKLQAQSIELEKEKASKASKEVISALAAVSASNEKRNETKDRAGSARSETAQISAQRKNVTKDQVSGGVAKQENALEKEAIQKMVKDMRNQAITTSTMINIVVVALAIVAAGVLLWPKQQDVENNQGQIQSLETDIKLLKTAKQRREASRASSASSSVQNSDQTQGKTQDQTLQKELQKLKSETGALKEQMGFVLEKAGVVSSEFLSQNAPSLQNFEGLEDSFYTILSAKPQLAGFMQTLQNLKTTTQGQAQLQESLSEINGLLSSVSFLSLQESSDKAEQNPENGQVSELGSQPVSIQDNIAAVLSDGVQKSEVLQKTFAGVASEDLQAAAMLIGFSQFRQSLNRDNQPFEKDLEVLMKLAGQNNQDLQSSLSRLAPHAQKGVLTPQGLSLELRALTGDVVMASLAGEEIDISQNANERMNKIFNIDENGQLTEVNPQGQISQEPQLTQKQQQTYQKVQNAQNFLQQGNIAGALSEMKTLEGAALQKISPWVSQASASLQARNVEVMVGRALREIKTLGGGRLIRNEETGITILKPGFNTNKSPY